MRLRPLLRHAVPDPVRRLGWRSYYRARNKWLKSIVGCRTNRKIVALTFDDGPNADYTPAILQILAQYDVKATFFVIGRNVVSYPEHVREIARSGHAIGNHTFTHRRLLGCSPVIVAKELYQCERAIRKVIGAVPKLLRPPFGEQDPTSFLTARLMGYSIVNWSVLGGDTQGDLASVVAERILESIQPGDIVLLHDGWKIDPNDKDWRPEYERLRDRSPTIEALPTIVQHLQGQRYEFVTLPEIIRTGALAKRSWFG